MVNDVFSEISVLIPGYSIEDLPTDLQEDDAASLLNAIADVCEHHRVWRHVDAAQGGGLLMSRQLRHKLAGIERADSVVWDAHKMLFVPALCAAVLYRNSAHRFVTFQQSAPYLFDPSVPGMADIDSGMRTIECTKRATGFGLWGLWALFGESIFEHLVDRTMLLARTCHGMLKHAADFEPLNDPECNIVVFRHLPDHLRDPSMEVIDALSTPVEDQTDSFWKVQHRPDHTPWPRCFANGRDESDDHGI